MVGWLRYSIHLKPFANGFNEIGRSVPKPKAGKKYVLILCRKPIVHSSVSGPLTSG